MVLLSPALGDSITEGSVQKCYCPHLARIIQEGGLEAEFVGPKTDKADGSRHAGLPNDRFVGGMESGGGALPQGGDRPGGVFAGGAVDGGDAATIVLAGSEDPVSTVATNERFARRMKQAKREVELFTFEGKAHELFKWTPGDGHYQAVLILETQFLQEQGWLEKRSLPEMPHVKFEGF